MSSTTDVDKGIRSAWGAPRRNVLSGGVLKRRAAQGRPSTLWDDRQQNVRSVFAGMVDLILGGYPFGLVVIIATSVQVAVESGEVTTRDFDADAVAGAEIVAGGFEIDRDLVDLARFHPDFFSEAFAIAGAQDALLHVVGGAIGVDVHQFRGEIGIFRRG